MAAAADAFGIAAEDVDFGTLQYNEGAEVTISNQFGYVGEQLPSTGVTGHA